MLYMSSQSTGDGHLQITITFRLGADIDKDLVLVENRAAVAVPQLPAAVQATGLIVRKSSPDILLAVHMYSPDNTLDQQYISNYFTLHVRDELLRLPGVGDLGSRAARDYAMRIWIDPDKAAAAQPDRRRRRQRAARRTTSRWPPARSASRRSGPAALRASSTCRPRAC